jgi:hypothetical protein
MLELSSSLESCFNSGEILNIVKDEGENFYVMMRRKAKTLAIR